MKHGWRGPSRPALLFVVLAAVWPAGCSTLTREFEYEEDVALSLDGRAAIDVNASLAALAALRGADVDIRPNARFDADRIRAFFTSPVTRVGRVSSYRRRGRRCAYVRIDVDDIRRLPSAPPFAWSTYGLDRTASEVVYRQAVGAAASRDVGDVGWTGRERVAFRLHLQQDQVPQRTVEEDRTREHSRVGAIARGSARQRTDRHRSPHGTDFDPLPHALALRDLRPGGPFRAGRDHLVGGEESVAWTGGTPVQPQ